MALINPPKNISLTLVLDSKDDKDFLELLRGPEGKPGIQGNPGRPATTEAVKAAVEEELPRVLRSLIQAELEKYFAANLPKQGEKGARGEGGSRGEQGDPGKPGADGTKWSADEVKALIKKVLAGL